MDLGSASYRFLLFGTLFAAGSAFGCAQGSVWITGFGVSDDGSALELEGRMSAPHLLPDYLRRLNQEARFRGRPFAQLSLNAIDRSSGAVLPYTEFALRSAAAKAP